MAILSSLANSLSGEIRRIGRRSPVTVERAGVRLLVPAPARMPQAAIATGAVGFLGATDDDQHRWLAAFRHLLDGLDAPLQVVMTFTPGAGLGTPPGLRGTGRRSGSGRRSTPSRARDMAFAQGVARGADAQARSVTLVTAANAAHPLAEQLRRMGIRAQVEPTPADAAPAAVLEGMESPSAFSDSRGYHRTWYLHRFSGLELEPGWLLKLIPPRHHVALAWFVEPLPTAWMVSYLQRQLAQMRARQLDQDLPSHTDPVLAGALPQAADLQRRIAGSEERAFHVALYLTLTTPGAPELEEGAAHVASAGRAALVEIHPCTFRMGDARLATLPLGSDPLKRRRVVDSSSLVTFFPWLDSEIQEPLGLVIGRSRATRCPVLLDPFHPRRANANIGVFGHSGAGKTYLLSTIAMGMLGRGGQVFIVDPEREYGSLAEKLGGVEVNLALGSGHAMNVLQKPPREAPGPIERWLGPAVADALDLIAVICGDLDETERAAAEAAIRDTYGSGIEEPVLADVAMRLPRGRTAQVLERWVRGSLGAMFSAPTNVDLDAPIVAFAMREMREELVAPVHFLVAAALWTRVKSRGRRTLLVVDELGLLFDDPVIRRFVVGLARRIRKYDGGLVFATQNPGDLLATDAGAVVASNPAIHLFGALRPGEAQKLQRAFQLSDDQRAALEGARRGDFLLLAGSERLMVEVRAPKWQEELMEASRAPPSVLRALRIIRGL